MFGAESDHGHPGATEHRTGDTPAAARDTGADALVLSGLYNRQGVRQQLHQPELHVSAARGMCV